MAQWLSYMLPEPAGPGSIPRVPDVAEVNQRRCLDDSGLKMLIEPV